MGRFAVLPETVQVRDKQTAQRVADLHMRQPVIAVDTETTGLLRPKDYAVIISTCFGHNRYAIWPEAFEYFAESLQDPAKKLIMWNANFDTWMLRNAGINIYKYTPNDVYRVIDTMIMHILEKDDRPHTLKFACRDYLGIEMVEFKAVFGKQMKKRPLHDVLLDPANRDVVANYAGLDAYATLGLFIELKKRLLQIPTRCDDFATMWDYFYQTEVPFTKVLYEAEREGVPLDTDMLISLAPEFEKEILKGYRWFIRETGKLTFNLNSGPQLASLFFDKLGYEPPSFTETGAPQITKGWLKRLKQEGCKYASTLLSVREAEKKLSTYVRAPLRFEHRGRIHPTFRQGGTATGRLSAKDPNLQNQPPFIRRAYIAPEGYLLCARDYDQLEMRILAHYTREPFLMDTIRADKDIHSSCASLMFGIQYEALMAAKAHDDAIDKAKRLGNSFVPLSSAEEELLGYRKTAKTLQFGLIYGMGPGKLAMTVNCSMEEAKQHVENYFDQFSKVKRYFETAIQDATEEFKTHTILGRHRQIPDLRSLLQTDIKAGERKVKNAPIQGSASEIAKMAMIKVHESRIIRASGAKMLVQIHDEILMKVPTELEYDNTFNNEFKSIMEHPLTYDLAVPLTTSGKYAETWYGTK